jgi:gliding motility-associated-like protein
MNTIRLLILGFIFCFSSVSLLSQNRGISINNKSEAPVLKFEENKNQFDPDVLYEVDLVKSGKLFLEKNCFTYLFWNPNDVERMHHPENGGKPTDWKDGVTVHFHSFKAEFLGANSDPEVTAKDPVSYYKNYFVGNDENKWASDVRLYNEITYSELYPFIDQRIYSNENSLEYDFTVSKGGDPSAIRIKYSGADKVSLKNGNLFIETSQGNITQQNPYAYQIIDGIKTEVRCNFRIDNEVVSFDFPDGYDKYETLVIDPTLIVSTYSGSTADNWGYTATYDQAGNIYAGGIANDFGYPTTLGAYQTVFGGGGTGGNFYAFDISLTKYNPNGTALLFSTYLGGSDNEQPQSIVVDNNDNLFVIGRTWSSDFPVTAGAYDASYNGGSDIIVTKFNPGGTALLGSTFIGGSGDDGVNITADFYTWNSLKYNYGDDGRSDIEVDPSGNCYVASSTQSSNFPVTAGAYQTTFGGGLQDAVVFKFNPSLSTLSFSTFLGGNANDAGYSIALNSSNEVYVSGGTSSTNFPTTPGVIHSTFQGGIADGFVTHLNSGGSAVLQSTFIGTTAYDQAYFVQLDQSFNVYLYGQTAGAYPVTAGVYSNPNSGQFIHKMNSTLNVSAYSTVFGSGGFTPNVSPAAFLVDTCENVYTSGWGGQCIPYGSTGSTTGLPTTSNAFQNTTDGCDFYFFVLKKNALSLWYASYMGGGVGTDEHVDGGTSRFDKRGVIYQSVCAGCGGTSNFPTTPGAWSQTNNSFNCNNAVVKIDFQLVNLFAVASAAPSDTICTGSTMNFTNNSVGAVDYVWNFGDGSQPDTNFLPSHTYTTAGSYTVTLIAIDSLSCKTSDSTHIYVVVLDPPVVNIGNDTTICGPLNITLNAGNPGMNYLWSTGATTQTINVNTTGTYWVNVTNGQCSDRDTIFITGLSVPPLGSDTNMCIGNSLTLNAGNPGATYLWNTGATSQTISVSSSGTYYVEATAGACTLSDTVDVNFIPAPVVNLGNDTILCPGQTITLDAGNPGTTYLWNTGATTQTITISVPGNYWVISDNGSCTDADTISVSSLAVTNLGNDTTLCMGNPLTLNAGNAGANYLWNTGATTQSISVSNSGTYYVTSSVGNCTQSDTVIVNFVPTPVVDLGNDSTLCPGQSFQLDAGNPGANYLWNNGQTTQSVTASGTGIYSVIVAYGSCAATDSILVHTLTGENLGPDKNLCDLYSLNLDAGTLDGAHFFWSTGDTTQIISVSEPGSYVVSVLFGQCILTDTINVNGGLGSPSVYVPNCFTPNGNGLNEIFYAKGDNITSFNMKIFDRWGELIFESSDINDGWDGFYKGSKVQNDVYVVVIDYTTVCTAEQRVHRISHVMVMR